METTPTDKPPSTASESEEETSHDKLFRTAFELFLRDLVEIVRPQLAATLDLDHARILPAKLFTDFRKQGLREPDVVAEVRTLDGEENLLVVHVDVEGRFRKAMDERMMEYGLHLVLKRKKPVISIAVFLSGGKKSIEVREVVWEGGRWVTLRFYYLAFCFIPCYSIYRTSRQVAVIFRLIIL